MKQKPSITVLNKKKIIAKLDEHTPINCYKLETLLHLFGSITFLTAG